MKTNMWKDEKMSKEERNKWEGKENKTNRGNMKKIEKKNT